MRLYARGCLGNLLPEGNIQQRLIWGNIISVVWMEYGSEIPCFRELYQEGKEIVYIFIITDAEAFIKPLHAGCADWSVRIQGGSQAAVRF